ncbi:MAG: CTP synthetase [Thermoplasmata archaeon]|nr:CTP synthase (glutamine hydrolyzing) [Euryarchaeota archaeon]RLF65223.1 MAG: CTP synthetase [Thermoplasmata archaeon]
MPNNTKYIFITGGVLSGLGKGITVSSIGRILKEYGIKVTAIKIDPYINWDAGTMNPFQHGEVFVLEDGGEVDLDFGNYERFLDENLTSNHSITTGKVFYRVIEKERKGCYLGETVQIIPHVTNEIKSLIRDVAENTEAEVVLIEIGGTVGDIESMPFLEAARQMFIEEGPENVMFIHVTLVPQLSSTKELKTKPTQHSVRELRAAGIQPDMIICRSPIPLDKEHIEKIALYSNVPKKAVISAPDVENTYEVPLLLESQGVGEYIIKRLKLSPKRIPDFSSWREFCERLKGPNGSVRIAIVGKYAKLKDAYLSVIEALKHAGAALGVKVQYEILNSELINRKNVEKFLKGFDGIIVPGGFGQRGVEGKIEVIRYARENDVPFLGICFGFQLTVIEYARNVLGLKDAHSTEIDPETPHPVIDLMEEQRDIDRYGGTMRLGGQKVILKEGSLAHRLYGTTEIVERHRHRYEVNTRYIKTLEEHGLVFSGTDETGKRMEILELPNKTYFIASQFHPEFKSRPMRPAPLFYGLVKTAFEMTQKTTLTQKERS